VEELLQLARGFGDLGVTLALFGLIAFVIGLLAWPIQALSDRQWRREQERVRRLSSPPADDS
jgi:hypothetical protein